MSVLRKPQHTSGRCLRSGRVRTKLSQLIEANARLQWPISGKRKGVEANTPITGYRPVDIKDVTLVIPRFDNLETGSIVLPVFEGRPRSCFCISATQRSSALSNVPSSSLANFCHRDDCVAVTPRSFKIKIAPSPSDHDWESGDYPPEDSSSALAKSKLMRKLTDWSRPLHCADPIAFEGDFHAHLQSDPPWSDEGFWGDRGVRLPHGGGADAPSHRSFED